VFALVALLCLVWGSTWIVITAGLRDLPPFTTAGLRFLVSAAIMSAIAPALARREGGAKPAFGAWFCVGLLNFGASYAIVYWSETRLPSGLTSVLWSVFPILMAVSGSLFLDGERIRGRQTVGFVLGFVGVALLFATDLRALSSEAIPTGLILLVSPLVSCVGTTILKKRGAKASSILVNRNAMWLGAALLCAAALILERDAPRSWTPLALFSIGYLAAIGTVLTLYFWLLRHVAAYRLSMIAYVTPAIALTLGTLIGSEPLTPWTVIGSATILCGVALVVMRPRRPALPPAGPQRA
jgi:drug/metabolite transporter (DMT)-like permease